MRFKLHASFFLGLHYDCLGSTDRAKKYMKKAFIYSGRGMKSDDVLGTACDLTLLVIYNDSHFKMFVDMLPLLHMKHRNFFDNDEVDEKDDLDLTGSSNYITALIKEEVEPMSRLSLQNDLKKDVIKCSSSNKTEVLRLFVQKLVATAATDNDFSY